MSASAPPPLFNTLQARDINVTVFSIAVFAEILLLYKSAALFRERRTTIFALLTGAVVFGLVAALVAWFSVVEFSDKKVMCVIKKPLNATMIMLSNCCCEAIAFIKMRAVNQGSERRYFMVLGALVIAFRIVASALNSAHGNTVYIPATQACTVTFSPYGILANVGKVTSNCAFIAMFIYPLRKQLKTMAGFASVHGSPSNEKSPAQLMFGTLVRDGIRYAIVQSGATIILYSLIVANILGNATSVLVYVEWVIMLFCTAGLITPPNKSATGTNQSGSATNAQKASHRASNAQAHASILATAAADSKV